MKDKARAWDKLNSAFGESIDWRYLEYIVIKEATKKDPHIAKFG